MFLKDFINEFLKIFNIEEKEIISIEQERKVISLLNKFLYSNYEGIGHTYALGKHFEYVSDFHKYWEKQHQIVLNPTINSEKCEQIGDILHNLYLESKNHFYKIYETKGLSKEVICQIRYFSASQDFKMDFDIESLFELYKVKPYLFDKQFVFENPETFIKETGFTMEQRDKRIKFLKESAKLLMDYNIEAFDLITLCKNDVCKLKELFINRDGLGIKDKKADMFIRDMVVLDIWEGVQNFESIGVASDSNTMKVALRTGILKTEIPLVTSFLDIFDYQHDLIYNANEKAWRRVWEIWKEKYPEDDIKSPCLMDYLIYKIIGKEYCVEKLYLFQCQNCNKELVAKSKSLKKCHHCKSDDIEFVARYIPCMHSKGKEVIKKNKFLSEHELYKNCFECPLASVCQSKNKEFVKYNPPKTISILSPSGWDRARIRAGEGGGGISA